MRIVSFKNMNSILKNYLQRCILQRKIPKVAYVDITFRCQFNCIYCGITSYPSNCQELSIKELTDVINQLVALKVPRIHFSGGEPLLRDGLENLISYACEKGVVTVLETNGWELSYNRILSLKKHHLNCICISLNGASEEAHDKCCGRKGSFLRVIEAIEDCKREKIPCVISTIVRRDLILSGELLEIFKLAKELEVSGIRLISPRPMGRWLMREEEILSIQEKIKAKKIANLTIVPLLGQGPNERICGAADNYSVFISPYGEVQPCGYIPYSFGNVRYESIASILRRLSNHEMFKMFKEGNGCVIQDCNFRDKYIDWIKPNSDLPIRLYKIDT